MSTEKGGGVEGAVMSVVMVTHTMSGKYSIMKHKQRAMLRITVTVIRNKRR